MKPETVERIRKFTEDRDWDQFHSPANLAKSIVIEAAELLECFQWSDENYDLQHVKEELADVIVYSQTGSYTVTIRPDMTGYGNGSNPIQI